MILIISWFTIGILTACYMLYKCAKSEGYLKVNTIVGWLALGICMGWILLGIVILSYVIEYFDDFMDIEIWRSNDE